MIEIVGWFGGILFATCAIPQVIQAYKTNRVDDLSLSFLWMWQGGEILTLIYVAVPDMQTGQWHWPLIVNYVFNIILICYLMYKKYKS